jgi:ubiquinone/menaquinone biosynthesis C-methylase UbiE
MARSRRAGSSSFSTAAHAYGRDAGRYDARTARYEVYRRRAVERLPVSAGDVVADVGCGTGLCFDCWSTVSVPRGPS